MKSYSNIEVSRQDPKWEEVWQGVNTPIRPTPILPWSPDPQATTHVYEDVPQTSKIVRSTTGGSWKQIRDSGEIVMKPHFVASNTVTNLLGGRYRSKAMIDLRKSNDPIRKVCFGYSGPVKLLTEWKEQGDFLYWSARLPMYDVRSDVADIIVTSIEEARASVESDFASGYDPLTDFVEVGDNIALINKINVGARDAFSRFFSEAGADDVRRAVKSGQTAQQLLRSAEKGLRRVGAAWMSYRYVLMPLVYSYRDIAEIIAEHGLLYKTYRSRSSHDISPLATVPLPGDGTRLVMSNSGVVVSKGTIKARYTKSGLRSLVVNRLDMNPFKTAWELIPLSFVIDWFLNVGQWIDIHTNVDTSVQAVGCIATKVNISTETFVEDVHHYTTSRSWTAASNEHCFSGTVGASHSFASVTQEAIRLEILDSYDRKVFKPGDGELSFQSDPFTWKRIVDSFVLSYNPLRTTLRRISR